MFYVEVRALIIGSEENSEDPPRKLVRAQQLAGGPELHLRQSCAMPASFPLQMQGKQEDAGSEQPASIRKW